MFVSFWITVFHQMKGTETAPLLFIMQFGWVHSTLFTCLFKQENRFFILRGPIAPKSPSKQKNANGSGSSSSNTKYRTQRRYNVTYLHLAACSKNLEIFKEKIDMNAVDINSIDNQSENSLLYAVRLETGGTILQLFQRENFVYAHKNVVGLDAIKVLKVILQNTKSEYLSELMSLHHQSFFHHFLYFLNQQLFGVNVKKMLRFFIK